MNSSPNTHYPAIMINITNITKSFGSLQVL